MQTITTSEWRLMRIIWTLKKATSAQIILHLKDASDWSDSTIKTLLKRLENKGFVTHNGESRNRKYYACVNESDLMKEQLLTLVNAMCAHKTGAVLTEIIPELPLSKSDCDTLINQLTQYKKNAPQSVPCNCLKSCSCK